VLFGRFVWADHSKNRGTGGWGSKEAAKPAEEKTKPEVHREKE
jgi:hypothetical protein